jgi:hypothetical protein
MFSFTGSSGFVVPKFFLFSDGNLFILLKKKPTCCRFCKRGLESCLIKGKFLFGISTYQSFPMILYNVRVLVEGQG